jgi:hypothetical protein
MATIGRVLIVHDDSALDLWRAATVRPKIIVAQIWIAYEAGKTARKESEGKPT